MQKTPEHRKKISEALLARNGANSTTKFCPRCKKILPRTVFEKRPNGYSQSYCPPCHKEYGRLRSRKHWLSRPENRPAQRLNNRKFKLKRFGLTLETYNQMVAAQNGKCAICKNPPDRQRANLDIDHCHKTGKVRGLLCSTCNRAIGSMNDSPERLVAAANYLLSFV